MIATTRYLVLLFLPTVLFFYASGQTSVSNTGVKVKDCKPPKNRELFHDYIDAQQKNILKSDGKDDGQFTPSSDEEVNFLMTRTAKQVIDDLQCKIESDTIMGDQVKKKYLKGLEYQLRFYLINVRQGKVNNLRLPDIVSGYEKMYLLDKEGKSVLPVIAGFPYETAYCLANADNFTFEKNPGIKESRDQVILKYCRLYPDKIFITLTQYPDVPFADSLVRAIAQRYPKQLYDYSQASNKLGTIIRNISDDKFISTVVKMSRSRDGQQYFCFLDNIMRGKLTFEEIDAAKMDSVLYYRLLVKTRMDYVKRALDKDTAFEYIALNDRLERKARENFVNTINALHTESAEVRFKCIQPLTPEELYYLAVSADGSIYTSSFVKGTYPLMMKKVNNKGDSLLKSLSFDRYRKFIKMAAGFNKLGDFLSTFPPKKNPDDESDAEKLMRAFVSRLETGNGLEDGVDVADSYASIAETLKPLANEMLKNVQQNYKRNAEAGNKRGMVIYNILNKLFLSADTTQKIDLTKELGIPPVYGVPYNDLTYDSTGKIAIQLFIYGDKDGIGLFPSLVGMFNNSNWKIDQSNKQWVTITAAKGKPVSLYMNRPLPEEGDEDAKAQAALCDWLEQNNIIPKVTINRGHSYNAPYTIEQMSTASKIVFMGSCGGYRSIHDILEKAEDAHIIGTKQIADAEVNNPFLKLLSEKLRNGSNIEWAPFWIELSKIATDPIFADYVPPHKNLGALFIKAYKKAMGE